MSKKVLYQNLITNLENNKVFYKFYHAITTENSEIEVFDGKNPCLLYGGEIPVFIGKGLPTLIADIAYEKDGKLYQILTNQEVLVIHEGINKRERNQIFAAADIKEASYSDLSRFISVMTVDKRRNISGYEYSYAKRK